MGVVIKCKEQTQKNHSLSTCIVAKIRKIKVLPKNIVQKFGRKDKSAYLCNRKQAMVPSSIG
ncbi:MAG: hypothetical protein D8H98_16780 [Prevotella sp.]|nr:MAG: hypothetical protein D8H98_16780 [Prevotella sp.]